MEDSSKVEDEMVLVWTYVYTEEPLFSITTIMTSMAEAGGEAGVLRNLSPLLHQPPTYLRLRDRATWTVSLSLNLA